jgi:hypothetical protein
MIDVTLASVIVPNVLCKLLLLLETTPPVQNQRNPLDNTMSPLANTTGIRLTTPRILLLTRQNPLTTLGVTQLLAPK